MAGRDLTSPAIVTPAAYERLVRARPERARRVRVVRVAPMDEPRTLALAARVALARAPTTPCCARRSPWAATSSATRALPGALLTLLEARRAGRRTAR